MNIKQHQKIHAVIFFVLIGLFAYVHTLPLNAYFEFPQSISDGWLIQKYPALPLWVYLLSYALLAIAATLVYKHSFKSTLTWGQFVLYSLFAVIFIGFIPGELQYFFVEPDLTLGLYDFFTPIRYVQGLAFGYALQLVPMAIVYLVFYFYLRAKK